MTHLSIEQHLQTVSKKKVKLRINNNHSTMLSVKWEPDCTKVSLHKMFLSAPQNIMDALACHVRKKNSKLCPSVKAYIDQSLESLDYSYHIKPSKLVTEGAYYDLKKLYDEVNATYFEGKLDLFITWFGKKAARPRSQITFGLYQKQLRLVKIHKMMDHPFFPDYFVKFVIYHEMLHHVCLPYHDENGRQHIHTKEFKLREKLFHDFEKAQLWMKNHYDNFFMM